MGVFEDLFPEEAAQEPVMRYDYSPAGINTEAVAAPIAAGAARGFYGLADLGITGLNHILPEGYEIPGIGNTGQQLADYIYPADLKAQVRREAKPWAQTIGEILGSGEEFATSGYGGAKVLQGLGKVAEYAPYISKAAPFISKLGEYGNAATKFDAELGATSGAAGEIARAMAGDDPALQDKYEQDAELLTGLAPVVPATLNAARAYLGKGIRAWSGAWSPEVDNMLSKTPAELGAERLAESRAAAVSPQGMRDPKLEAAINDKQLSNLAGETGNVVADERIKALPYEETKALQKGMLSSEPLPDSHVVGKQVQDELMDIKTMSKEQIDEKLSEIDLSETLSEEEKLQLKALVKEARGEMVATTGSDAQDMKFALQTLYKMAAGKGPFKKGVTLAHMRDAKQNLQPILEKAGGKAKVVAGKLMDGIRNDMSPEELQNWWSDYKEFAQTYENTKSNIVAKLTETHPGVNVDPQDATSAFQPKLKGSEVFDVLKKAEPEDIAQLELVLGKGKTQGYLKQVYAADLQSKLDAFTRAAPKGAGVQSMADFKNQLLTEATKWKKIYGEEGYKVITDKISKLKNKAEVRELSHTLSSTSPISSPGMGDVPLSRAGMGTKVPQVIPSLSGFVYAHPANMVERIMQNKAGSANRVMFNTLTEKSPFFSKLSTDYKPGFLEKSMSMLPSEALQVPARQGGNYANQLADAMGAPATIAVGAPDPGPLPSEYKGKEFNDVSAIYKELGMDESDKKKVDIGGDVAATTDSRKFAEQIASKVIRQESAGNANAISNKGAAGLMQLMGPAKIDAAASLGLDPNELSLLDPEDNVKLGKEYLAMMKDRFGSAELALAAYNAGPTAVSDFLKKAEKKRMPKNWKSVEKLMSPHKGYAETIDYVKKIYG